jgi:hypothetical protein
LTAVNSVAGPSALGRVRQRLGSLIRLATDPRRILGVQSET